MSNKVDNKRLKEFGLLIGFGLPLLFGWFLPLIFDHEFKIWTLMISIPFFIIGLTKPSLLLYPYNFWMSIGHILGWINSRIILGFIFVIILLPLSFIMRMLGYDPLNLKKNNLSTYKKEKLNYKINLKKNF